MADTLHWAMPCAAISSYEVTVTDSRGSVKKLVIVVISVAKTVMLFTLRRKERT